MSDAMDNNNWCSPSDEQKNKVAKDMLRAAFEKLKNLDYEEGEVNDSAKSLRAIHAAWIALRSVRHEAEAKFKEDHPEKKYHHGFYVDDVHVLGTAVLCIASGDEPDEYHPTAVATMWILPLVRYLAAAKMAWEAEAVLDLDDDCGSFSVGEPDLMSKLLDSEDV